MIYLLWCTVRPTMFVDTHKYWMDNCIDRDFIITKVAVNTHEQKEEIKEYCDKSNCEVIVVGDHRKGSAYATYCLTSNLEGEKNDIVVLGADDTYAPQGWDEYLKGKFANFSGGLLVRDGFQDKDDFNGIPSMTVPIMTFECLERLNKIICHPAYNHLFCDSELYVNLMELGLLKDDRKNDMTIFEHKHHLLNKRQSDEHDERNGTFWNTDAATFFYRINLPIAERLKV